MARPTTALIVDDEAHVRMFIRLVLQELGVTKVWEASSGKEAVERAVTDKPEIVLMDLNMPQLGGLEALTQIRELEPDIPVVIMTAQSSVKSVNEAIRLGAHSYLLKHNPKKQVTQSLKEIIDSL